MNQGVQIQDGYTIDTANHGLVVIASAGGQLVTCIITGIDIGKEDAFYQEYQFDIEEKLIELIEDEAWDEEGIVWLDAKHL